ncbi:MAG: TIGR03936 family radical SAM-associated protein [Lachnospiraceae bacterium]|nr:TIGR03936 family radical SAM-associated protein [Lachnospiraceae bacterium]
MTVRIKFAKYGNLKFLSHLDVMRFFQKAIRRAEIDVKYSEGYHPHQLMSFAAPLGVGQTSEGEYFDLELESMGTTDEILEKLDAQMPDGFKILHVSLLPPTPPQTRKESLMALVKASDYLVLYKGLKELPLTKEEFLCKFSEFVKESEILAIKTTKVGDTEINLAPFIYDVKYDVRPTELTENYDNGLCIYVMLSAGNENHIRPELLMKAFHEYLGIEYDQYGYQVHRLEAYAKPENEFIPIFKLHENEV